MTSSLEEAGGLRGRLNTAIRSPENWLHLTCLLLMFWFISTGNDGQYRIDGDDLVLTEADSITERLRGPRYLLCTACYAYRNWFFGSFANAMIFTWILFGLSGLLLYAILRRAFSPGPALLASLLYLGYSSKHEDLTWFGASFYVAVMVLILVTFLLLTTELSPLVKGALIAVFGWISMFGYEIFVGIAPVYLLYMAGKQYAEERRVSGRTLLGGAIPILVVPAHLGFIAAIGMQRIWHRAWGEPGYGELSLVTKVWLGFLNSLSATVGPRHFRRLEESLESLTDYYVKREPQLIVLAVVLCVVVGVAVWLSTRPGARSCPDSKPTHWCMGLLGLYTLLATGVPSFVGGVAYTPSRLTFLPSTGLCIAVCALLEIARRWVIRRVEGASERGPAWRPGAFRMGLFVVGAAAFAYGLTEAGGLTSIVHQNRESAILDRNIANQIKSIYPHPEVNETFFVTLPRSYQCEAGYWRQGPSAFEAGRGDSWLWYVYGTGVNSMRYRWARRTPRGTAQVELGPVIEEWVRDGIPPGLVPFYIDDNWKVAAIQRIQVVDESGKVQHELQFPKHKNTDLTNRIDLQLVKSTEGYVD